MAEYIKGTLGSYWSYRQSNLKPQHVSTLACHIMHAPWVHPAWSQYAFSLIHLRDMKDVPPAKIGYSGATHELVVIALNRDYVMDPEVDPNLPLHYLTPVNHALQFIAPSDALALGRYEECMKACINGQLSPDTDFRQSFEEFIRRSFTGESQ